MWFSVIFIPVYTSPLCKNQTKSQGQLERDANLPEMTWSNWSAGTPKGRRFPGFYTRRPSQLDLCGRRRPPVPGTRCFISQGWAKAALLNETWNISFSLLPPPIVALANQCLSNQGDSNTRTSIGGIQAFSHILIALGWPIAKNKHNKDTKRKKTKEENEGEHKHNLYLRQRTARGASEATFLVGCVGHPWFLFSPKPAAFRIFFSVWVLG